MKIRDGQIDVAILAGPRLRQWPTQGVRVLSRHCSDAGLKVGWYGGPGMRVRGVLPLESSGALVMVEDVQGRLHRIQAKSVIKVSPELEFPLPFDGWYSPGLIPEATARKLLTQGSLNWQSVVVILGTGNRALRLGAELLESHLSTRVVCVESVYPEVRGWEVDRRRFEMRGGKIIFGKPVLLSQKSPFLWSIKIQDDHGIRVIDVARVISVGPFSDDSGFREYPPGSLLIEWENSEASLVKDDVEKVLLDENRAVVLASQIIKGLTEVPSDLKSGFDRALWAGKQKLKELESLKQRRFSWSYDGKWLSPESKRQLHEFEGVPKALKKEGLLASIECVEKIGCKVCEKVCPAHAIKIDREQKRFLIEDRCTGCGFCLQVCPSQVPVMIEGEGAGSYSTLVLPFAEKPAPKKGDRVGLLSRKGEVLVQGRVLDQFLDGPVPLFKVETPSHLIWEVRGMLPLQGIEETSNSEDFYQERGTRVEVQIHGESRRVREGQMVSVALFEIGMARPNDILMCEDGSCGLCQIQADGVKKFACETQIHQGMDIRFTRDHPASSELCPCEGITCAQLTEKIDSVKPDTLEALSQVIEVGQGKCHGLLCKRSWIELSRAAGVESERYNDWSFPWGDWTVK
ncbi:MAG: 4Fe-4S binding protein [Bdellovibrionales bacterium]|nr:4Fe-4S binding protein [Bdellovibrionales bacterium]